MYFYNIFYIIYLIFEVFNNLCCLNFIHRHFIVYELYIQIKNIVTIVTIIIEISKFLDHM